MPAGSHLAEVASQGIFGSLTGYYESGSLFCNTVHLYVFATLLVVPLLLGILTGGSTSLGWCIGYVAFIVLLFAVLKGGVMYLHSVFDRTEPMVKSKAATVETFRSPVSSFSTTRRETSNVDGTIEMSELNAGGQRRTSGEAEVVIETRHDSTSSSDSSSGHSHYSAASGDSSANELLTISQPPARTVLPADSLELIAEYRRSSDCEMGRGGIPGFARKHSHPNLALINRSERTAGAESPKTLGTGRTPALINSDTAVGNYRDGVQQPLDFQGARRPTERRRTRLPGMREDEGATPGRAEAEAGGVDGRTAVRSRTFRRTDAHRSTATKIPAAVLHRTLDRLEADNLPEIDASDLKGQITKFLEELIEKHPETLDAIESVALRRLGRPTLERGSIGSRADESRDRPPEPQETAMSLYRSFRDDDTHVAYDHDDTTEGAVHSFQDEKGNWWAYAFDGHSNGTAQALGSIAQALIDRRCSEGSIDERPPPLVGEPPGSSGGKRRSRGRSAFRHCRSLSSTNRNRDINRLLQRLPTVPSDSPLDAIVAAENGGRRPARNSLSESGGSFGQADGEDSDSGATSRTPRATSMGETNGPPQSTSEAGSSSRPFISFVNLASRIYSSQLQRNAALASRRPDGGRSRLSVPISADASLIDVPNVRQRTALEAFALESRRRAQTAGAPMHPTESYSSINFIEELRQLYAPVRPRAARQPPSKLDYYYRLKLLPRWLPFGTSGLKVKLNRLSLNRLFDRNHSWGSIGFDVWIAAMVAMLAALIFSLLRSVQPDAASPIHGFNVLVAYSRPIYFCLFALVVLAFDFKLTAMGSADVEHLIVGLRDVSALALLLLPISFTIGLLPQLNTLAMHVCEQVELHVFGGTATFSPLSAFLAVVRSAAVVGLLGGFGHLVRLLSPESTQSVIFSAFVAVLSSAAYLLSRWSSNPEHLRIVFSQLCSWRRSPPDRPPTASSRVAYHVKADGGNSTERRPRAGPNPPEGGEPKQRESSETKNLEDPLPGIIRRTLTRRIHHDFFFIFFNLLFVFALHSTSVFTTGQPYFELACFAVCFLLGMINHYVYPQLRAHTPWKVLARPILPAARFETTVQARLMGFERLHVWMRTAEKTVAWPLLVISLTTSYAWTFPLLPAWATALFAFRLIRGAYSNPQMMWLPLGIAFCLCKWIFGNLQWDVGAEKPTLLPLDRFGLQNVSPLVVVYFCILVWPKIREFELKMNFIMILNAPWQIAWGSALHAFAQPFSVPHSGPPLRSSDHLVGDLRPAEPAARLLFWEKHYNTKSVDSNLRLSSMLEKGPLIDDSSLNSIFYEHLTRSLQQSLAGDLTLGRWGCTVEPGDCFILVSLYLSCLLHIIEVGNGFVTFQVRGLEFRGTYCHQREAEAIGEDQHTADTNGCCCCSFGVIPGFLSYNTAFGLRWLAWEVTSGKYIIDGYSITDNSAVNLLQVHELRRLLVTFYVKCIIYYALKSPSLESWLTNESILLALDPIRKNARYLDSDPIFCAANDEDYDIRTQALSRHRFFEIYGPWINYCLNQRLATNPAADRLNAIASSNLLNSFCFALSILGRRALGAAAYNRHANAAESFLYGLHSLFKGDMRIGSAADEWVFADPSILSSVISPAVRMALKLHQDHFAAMDDFEDLGLLFQRIQFYQTNIFISHEHDPNWRQSIIANTPSLLALRHQYDESQDDYKIIMLNKMHLNMRVIKLNRECVRAFWAGQQQELIFLRNRNPERGSIQNARQVLRNMINSSADQPIGYPIYVSPLTTSFVETHEQVNTGSFTFYSMYTQARRVFSRLRQHFGTSTSSNLPSGAGGMTAGEGAILADHQSDRTTTSSGHSLSGRNYTLVEGGPVREANREDDNISHTISLGTADQPNDAVHRRCKSDAGNTSAVLRSVAQSEQERAERRARLVELAKPKKKMVEIVDCRMVARCLNEPLRSRGRTLVVWPDEAWRQRGGSSGWGPDFEPSNGLRGEIVHEWTPCNPDIKFRSAFGHTLLLHYKHENNDLYIPIQRQGVRFCNEGAENEPQETETNL
ncbi:Pecanex-like protein [Aphelenchoides fujianensis]|nr:Pecanex-like protein [Aphelenchoides fujianensis]